ncbi:carbohydrate binding domain-containing protein, partial [Streptomyces sp. SID12501]
LVQGRTQSWNGAAVDVTDVLVPGATYTIGLWLRLPTGSSEAGLRVSVQRDVDGVASYETVTTVERVTSQWTQVVASYTPGRFDTASLYVESTGSLTDFLLDDVLVSGVTYTPDLSLPSVADALADDFPF